MQLETAKGDDGFDLGEEVNHVAQSQDDVADVTDVGVEFVKPKVKRQKKDLEQYIQMQELSGTDQKQTAATASEAEIDL